MDHLVDTNVLLRSVGAGTESSEATFAVTTLLRLRERLCICPQNLIEFWSVSTRPLAKNGLGLSLDEASLRIDELESIFTVLAETSEIYRELRLLVTAHRVAGPQVYDARLVAVMRVYGISRILTFNGKDFEQYAGVRVVHPREVSA